MAYTIVVGPKQVTVTVPAAVERYFTDSAYLDDAIRTSWRVAGNPDEIPLSDLAYWRGKALNPDTFTDGWVRVGWNGYWEARMAPGNDGSANVALAGTDGIIGKPSDFGFDDAESSAVYEKPVPLYQKAAKGITPQLGLLEDDILYNLSLLAKNVLHPIKARYPNMVVVSGFRQVNTGKSQHERGEAADIQIQNQTPELLLEVAQYIASSLQFDQLILHYTDEGRSWIHVSFTERTLRRQVLTRDYDDTYYPGLYAITPLVGEERAAAVRETATLSSSIDTQLAQLTQREQRLTRRTVSGDPIIAADAGGVIPDRFVDVVLAVWNTRTPAQWGFSDSDPSATESVPFTSAAGRFIEAVVTKFREDPVDGPQWGTLVVPFGRNYNQHSVDHVAFAGVPGNPSGTQPNGGTITPVLILQDSTTSSAKPCWTPETPFTDASEWQPDVPKPEPDA